METPRRIGLVGLGAMGRPMARHLLHGGYEVAGCDVSRGACDAAAKLGTRIASSPADLARTVDLVMIVVGFDQEVEDVMFGKGGVLDSARHGLIVAIGSTISPSCARKLAARVDGTGLVMLDMALTRGEPAAEAGKMLIMGGGDEAGFEACRPVFAQFASDVFNLGPFGSGQVGKLINNAILWACIAANDEALRFGERLGVEERVLRNALVHSSAQNWALSSGIEKHPMPWAEKDLSIAQAEADRIRFSIPLSGVVKELVKELKLRRGYPTPEAQQRKS